MFGCGRCANTRHDTTALNPRELECKSIDRLRPSLHSQLPPPRSTSSSSYLPAVVSLRTLPPFVALSRPFWRTREEEGRAQPRGNGGGRRGVTRLDRGGERGKIRPPFFSQDSNTDANPSPMQGKGWVFCFSSLRLFCSLSVSQIVDIPLRPAASGEKTIKTRLVHESSRFLSSNRIERRSEVANI